MERKNIIVIATFVVCSLVLTVSSILIQDQYLLPSLAMVMVSMVPLFIRFERKAFHSREVVIIALLAAIAAVSRIPFAVFPGVQPTTFVIIVTALVFGGEIGLLVGAVAALVSNMFLGQGPWTPWQMLSWGTVGLTAGMLRNTWWMKHLWGRCTFGFIWGFLFGWIMNLWMVIGLIQPITWAAILPYYLASFYFDLAHALSNVFFLALFSAGWLKILLRIKKKFGI